MKCSRKASLFINKYILNFYLLSFLYIFENVSAWRLVILLKCFTWKKISFAYKEWTKKISTEKSTEAKIQGQRLKVVTKNDVDKNIEKESILYDAGAIHTVQGIFSVFQTCDSYMYQSSLFKNGKKCP